MRSLYYFLILGFRQSDGHYEQPDRPEEQIVGQYGETRRILRGTDITDTRPYMVYLRASPTVGHSAQVDPNWLCGGVIIHPRYILTSAACIEDVVHFYVVSGTHRWLPITDTNECIKNGAFRAIWKCVPKSYRYDGGVFNNIRWMVNDIAVVKIDGDFSFTQRVKGCDFIPQSIAYNNESMDLENPGKVGAIAGWGSTETFTEAIDLINTRNNVNSPNLLEAEVIVVKKSSCKNLWLPRYHQIIEQYMICGKNIPMDELSQACDGTVECRQLVYSEEELPLLRRGNRISHRHLLRSLAQLKRRRKMRKSARKSLGKDYGGFCENDHGGPLIVGHGKSAVVIGIISAYRSANHSKTCLGPFLYSSVYKNRYLINCALYKDIGESCAALLKMSGTVLDEETIHWSDQDRKPAFEKQNKKAKAALRSDKMQQNNTARFSQVSRFSDNDEEQMQDHEAVNGTRIDTQEDERSTKT